MVDSDSVSSLRTECGCDRRTIYLVESSFMTTHHKSFAYGCCLLSSDVIMMQMKFGGHIKSKGAKQCDLEVELDMTLVYCHLSKYIFWLVT